MTKISKKLFVFLSVMVCSLCLCLGLAACNPDNGNTNEPDNGDGHTHIFAGAWLYDGAEGHYQLATCHPEVKSELEPHVDDDEDGICDVCEYPMTGEDDGHTHTFAGAWLYDGAEGHYRLATCHPEVKSELEPHVDNDEDGICDVCEYPMTAEGDGHTHEYAEEWSFNENMHWHNATCEHFIERSDYNDHSFVQGVCECGVKESEVKVYELYKNSPEYDLYFLQWLDWLADNGVVEVEFTESGDGIYHYADGSSEVRFLGERAVKVQAVSDGDPVADVWFMVSMYQTSQNKYYESSGTIALGIAKTDSKGIAEITFRPVGGYSSSDIEYRIRIAEKKDIAVLQGVNEEDASLPIPNRYGVAGGEEGFEFEPYEVSENGSSDDIAATIKFTYSAGWNAYNKFYLPYRRYWADQLNGTDIQEEGFEYSFTLSGDNLFDYFYFSPQQYDYKQGSNADENLQIVENAKIAASGNYRISFTVEGDATAVLYFWDEDGVHLDGVHQTNSDGTPHNDYITAISGEGDTDKYTGGNFIDIEIAPDLGLRMFQFGIKSDVECKVTFTVERTGDYDPYKPHYYMEKLEDGRYGVGVEDEDKLTFEAYKDTLINFALPEVPAGLYTISFQFPGGIFDGYSGGVGDIYAYTPRTSETDKVSVWQGDGPSGNSETRQSKGIIRIHEGDDILTIDFYGTKTIKKITVLLEAYELPEFEADGENAYLPVAPEAWENPFINALIASPGTYTLEILAFVYGSKSDTLFKEPIKVYIGGNEFTTGSPEISTGNPMLTISSLYLEFTTTVTVTEQDDTISLLSALSYSLTAMVKLTAVTE